MSMRLTPLVALLSLTVAAASAKGAEPCFARGDQCLSAEDLAASGVATVRFQPMSLARTDDTTSWKLYAYRANGTVLPQVVEARWPAFVQGEDGVLALQETLCAALIAGGVACNSDFLHGRYIKTNGAPFDVSFVNTSRTDLTASGRFTTRRWSCTREGDEGQALETQVTCEGAYHTSRRLLYLTNSTYLNLVDVTCAATAQRLATDPGAARSCPADGEFDSSWLPTGGTTLNIRPLGPNRLQVPERQLSLLRQ